MAGITFSYDNAGSAHKLALRHGPYNVNWTYNVNTSVTDTYTGQVVQVLGVNIDRLIIDGQFGREGATGRKLVNGKFIKRSNAEQFDSSGAYPGLYAMTEFFRGYFAISAQGGDDPISNANANRYMQVPMQVSYEAGTSSKTWKITPVSFPSFKRTNEDFAPLWKIEAYVIEADATIQQSQSQQVLSSINRLRGGIGFKPANPFSDPAADSTSSNALEQATELVKGFKKLLPAFTIDELRIMVWNRVSVPKYEGQNLGFDPAQVVGDLQSETVPGEITGSNVPIHAGFNP